MGVILADYGVPFRGKLGTMVGYMRYNKMCIRSYRKSINYPNTVKQQEERRWFIEMVRFAAQAKFALKKGLSIAAAQSGITEGNYFIAKNKQHFKRHQGHTYIDYAKLQIAEGNTADVFFKAPEFEENEIINVSFERNTILGRGASDDKVYIFIYSPDNERGILSQPVDRRTKKIRIKLPDEWNNSMVHIYGFVIDRNGKASNSTYIGCGKVNHTSENGRYIPINKSWNDFVEIANRSNQPLDELVIHASKTSNNTDKLKPDKYPNNPTQ